jgi:hypothetical protein
MARSRNSRKLHVAAVTEISIAGHRMPLVDTGDTQPNDIPPNSTKGNTTTTRLLSTTKTGPPLSQSLRPEAAGEGGEGSRRAEGDSQGRGFAREGVGESGCNYCE